MNQLIFRKSCLCSDISLKKSCNRDHAADIRQTQRSVRTFIARPTDQILASAPVLPNRLSVISQSAGGVIGLTGGLKSTFPIN